jgi:hypothetical protein
VRAMHCLKSSEKGSPIEEDPQIVVLAIVPVLQILDGNHCTAFFDVCITHKHGEPLSHFALCIRAGTSPLWPSWLHQAVMKERNDVCWPTMVANEGGGYREVRGTCVEASYNLHHITKELN